MTEFRGAAIYLKSAKDDTWFALPAFAHEHEGVRIRCIIIPSLLNETAVQYRLFIFYAESAGQIGGRMTVDGHQQPDTTLATSSPLIFDRMGGDYLAFRAIRTNDDVAIDETELRKIGTIQVNLFRWSTDGPIGAGTDVSSLAQTLDTQARALNERDVTKTIGVSTVSGGTVAPESIRHLSCKKVSLGPTLTCWYATAENFSLRGILPDKWRTFIGRTSPFFEDWHARLHAARVAVRAPLTAAIEGTSTAATTAPPQEMSKKRKAPDDVAGEPDLSAQ